MVILGVDPGLRHTGWCVLDGQRIVGHGVIVLPGHGKVSTATAFSCMLAGLADVLADSRVDVAAVEEVVWQGHHRAVTLPLGHVAGALVGLLVGKGIPVYVLSPTMKEKGGRFGKGWAEHDKDAARLARRIQRVVFAVDRQKPAAALVQARATIAARLVRGLL